MATDASYRQALYEKYFTTQVKRDDAGSLTAQLGIEWVQLRADLEQWLPSDRQSQVLDIGCGYGSLLLLLQNMGYTHLAGIDLSPEQIETAQSLGLSKVYCADAFDYLDQLPADTRYDLIVMFDVVEHLQKSELLRLLQLIRSRLSSVGRAIFRTPNMDAPFTSLYAYGDYTHETLLNSRSAAQLMHSAGFEEVQVLASPLIVHGFWKSLGQKISFALLTLVVKIAVFATARSSRGMLLTPNMLIVAKP